jgi:hypothetical protein
MTHSLKSLSSFLYLSLAAIAGCGGDSFATEPGQSVLVDSATSFALVSTGGGLVVPPPQGAACDPQIWTYTVHLDSSQLAWNRCNVDNSGTEPADYVPSTGTRTLTADELASAKAAARLVHVSGEMVCGADKPSWHISVSSPAGMMVYGDDFYSCLKREAAYVEGQSLSNLHTVLVTLVCGPGLGCAR